MSSQLNLDVLGNPIPTPAPKPITVSKSNGLFGGIPLWVMLIVIVGVVLYFMPSILNFLSLPEKVLEEEVKKVVDGSRTQKILEDASDLEEVEKLEGYGYCYVGTDRGIRSCIDVKPGDQCMSGKIFPRRDICINPSLRL
jgi:hypothetical protein